MDRFNKIWTTALAGGLTAAGLVIILEYQNSAFVDTFFNSTFDSVFGTFIIAAVYVVLVAVAFIFHIIAHEGGHCIGGLLSGYEFASFRVFNIMIVKRDGKYLRKKFHMVGTGGQCLMAPPQPFRPDYPYKLYNLAGGLTNLIIAAVCIALAIPIIFGRPDLAWVLLILLPLIVAGVFCGVTNLVPMIIGGVSNDGWNLAHLGNDPKSRRILWLLLDVMAIINRGGQFRDMPEEWFAQNTSPLGDSTAKPTTESEAKPTESELKPTTESEIKPTTKSELKPDFGNSFQCALAVYRFNYLVDTGRFWDAEILAQEILDAGAKVMQLYRYEITCGAIFLELIGNHRLDRVERLYTPELERYIKATASYPHRQRLRYAMALLYHRQGIAEGSAEERGSKEAEALSAEEAEALSKAAKALELFAKACKTYPNDGEISSEWELIGLVDCKLAELNAIADDEANGNAEVDTNTDGEAQGSSPSNVTTER